MAHPDRKDPKEVAASLLLAAGFLIEETSAELALPPSPSRELLQARIVLVEDTASQLRALARAARAAIRLASE